MMKKKFLAFALVATMAASITACGGNESTSSANEVAEPSPTAEATPETTEAPVETPEATPEATPDATPEATPEATPDAVQSAESASPDAGEVIEEDGMRKEPVYTNKELNITGQTGPMNYTIEAIQVSRLTATTDEMAQFLGIDKDKEVALVAINASAENTSQDTISFYLGQSTITTNTKEQVDSDTFLSEYIDGEFLGNVVHSGNMIFILPNSSASDITNVTLYVDAPFGSDFMSVGDDVQIDIALQ